MGYGVNKFCKPDKDGFCKSCNEENRKSYDVCIKTKEMKKDIISLAGRFLEERKKWIEAGRPMRKQEEITELFQICATCPNFQKSTETTGSCGICGCGLKSDSTTMNKLAWGTTKCPLDEPKWEESKEVREASIAEKKGGCGCGGKKN